MTTEEKKSRALSVYYDEENMDAVAREPSAQQTAPRKTTSPHSSLPFVTRRVIYSDMMPKEVNTHSTVASLFLGEGSSAEHLMFDLGVRNGAATGTLWALWYIGATIGLLVVAKLLPMSFVWASLLMLPLPVVTLLLLSLDLLYEVVQSLDLYIILILQIALFIDGIVNVGGMKDPRSVFWCCYLPTMVASGLVDAYPAKYRSFFAKLFFSAAVCILVIWNCLLPRWIDAKLYTLSFAMHHLSDQMTLLVFYCRHLYRSVWYPNYFVMIKGEVLCVNENLAIERDVEQDDKEHEHHFLPHQHTQDEVMPSVTRQFSGRRA